MREQEVLWRFVRELEDRIVSLEARATLMEGEHDYKTEVPSGRILFGSCGNAPWGVEECPGGGGK